jgi:peptidoglycan/xylan/chitin deacetylase (PgdA/CDA1 family)
MKKMLALGLSLSLLFLGCAPAVNTQETTQPSQEPTQETVDLTGKKLIALTFDDGPNEFVMPAIMDVRKKHNATATFFLIGRLINNATAKVVKNAWDLGFEIANHGQNHVHMENMTADEVRQEFETVQAKVEEITGQRPKFFRPPFLSASDTMYHTIDLPMVGGFSCQDWKEETTVQMRIDSVLKNACDGGVILLHCSSSDGGSVYNIKALDTLIPALREQGYEFVTLSQLFAIKGVTPVPHEQKIYKIVGESS